MELNQTTLRGILAAVLSVDPKYVVPKQGNWWNPQTANANIENWCAYQIRSNQPRTAPFYHQTLEGQNGVVVEKIAQIDLQFVGPQSEDLANSVAMWPLRSDVKAQLATVHGAILYNGMTAVSSPFYQEGLNTVMAWNTQINVAWYSIQDTTQKALTHVTIN